MATASRERIVAQSADGVKERRGAVVTILRSLRASSSSSATVGNDRIIQSLDTGTLFEASNELLMLVAVCGLLVPH